MFMENTNKDKIIKKWKPILEKFNVDPDKMHFLVPENTIKVFAGTDINKELTENQSENKISLNKLHSRIIICGSAASGKDHLRKKFEDKGYKYGISYTTRPPRTGEINGVDYHFLTNEEF